MLTSELDEHEKVTMADPALEALITAPHRSPDNIARNAARHPVETLDFFGLSSNCLIPSLEKFFRRRKVFYVLA